MDETRVEGTHGNGTVESRRSGKECGAAEQTPRPGARPNAVILRRIFQLVRSHALHSRIECSRADSQSVLEVRATAFLLVFNPESPVVIDFPQP